MCQKKSQLLFNYLKETKYTHNDQRTPVGSNIATNPTMRFKSNNGYMSFNVERKVTGNKHFRRAIAMAYDKASLVNNAHERWFQPQMD